MTGGIIDVQLPDVGMGRSIDRHLLRQHDLLFIGFLFELSDFDDEK